MLGLPYDSQIDMWSFGCIILEMLTGRPFFSASDENEWLEILRCRIGMPPQEMIDQALKKDQFINSNGELRRSDKSRVPRGIEERS